MSHSSTRKTSLLVTLVKLWGFDPRREVAGFKHCYSSKQHEGEIQQDLCEEMGKERHAFANIPQPKCINQYPHKLQVILIRPQKWWWSVLHSLSAVHFVYQSDHQPTHLITDCMIVFFTDVWHRNTEPRKEISAGFLCCKSGKMSKLLKGQSTQWTSSRDAIIGTNATVYLVCMQEMQGTAHWGLHDIPVKNETGVNKNGLKSQ